MDKDYFHLFLSAWKPQEDLFSLSRLLGYRILAVDGDIGKIHDFLLDPATWRIRHVVIETGGWLRRQHLAVAPSLLGSIRRQEAYVPVRAASLELPNVSSVLESENDSVSFAGLCECLATANGEACSFPINDLSADLKAWCVRSIEVTVQEGFRRLNRSIPCERLLAISRPAPGENEAPGSGSGAPTITPEDEIRSGRMEPAIAF